MESVQVKDSDQLFSVAEQIVLVTGGSRGIGQAIAGGFAQRGAIVEICSRNEDAVQETVRKFQAKGWNVSGSTCDVSLQDDIERTVGETLRKHGRIDTLINVAGINKRKRAESFTGDEYRAIMDVNLHGAYAMSMEVGRHMMEQKAGVQINVQSLNTHMPLKGVLPYAMSKFGMQGMTRGLALEWGPYGIRVNSLAPGFILTDMSSQLWSDPTMLEWNNQNAPLGRLGQPEDMVGTAIFLACSASAFMTGQTLYVDGGFSSGWNWPIPLD